MPPQTTSQPPPPPQRQELAPVIFMLILTFFLFSTPDQGTPSGYASPRDYAAERVARTHRALDVLNSSRWQDFAPESRDLERGGMSRYLNLTGFRREDEYLWGRMEEFRERGGALRREVRRGTGRNGGPGEVDADEADIADHVYYNVTGVVRGRWTRVAEELEVERRQRELNLSSIAPGVDWAYWADEDWTRNITGKEGKMMLRMDEKTGEFDSKGPSERSPPKGSEANGTSWSTDFIREVAATMTIRDESSSGDGWEMRVHGVHWPREGVILMTTTSDKFAGIFGLPHLTPNAKHFSTSQNLLNRTLEKTVERMENSLWADASNPWTSSPESQGDAIMPVPHCEFVVYAQVYPAREQKPAWTYEYGDYMSVEAIERELRFPTGAPIPSVPELQMSMVIFSPDCGFMLESKGPPRFSPVDGQHLVGQKQEVYLRSVRQWMLALGAVLFGQTLLLSIQSKEASTPSTVGRVSLYTIGMMLAADALLFSSLCLLSGAAPNIFPSALLASASAVLSVGLGVRFSSAIYNVQEPERRERLRAQEAAEEVQRQERLRAYEAAVAASRARLQAHYSAASRSAGITAPVITAAGADIVPQATTPPTPATRQDEPIIIPSDQDISAEILENTTNAASAVPLLPTANPATTTTATTQAPRQSVSNFGALYVKTILILILLLFTTLSSLSWSLPLRTAYTHLLSFTYLSFWIPQIRRNIIRNCRKAFLWKFILGQSVLRLLPFAYFYLKEDNILFADTDWKAFCALAAWVWIQVWGLVAQEVLGPRWGLPKNWTDEGWDYHPVLREDNLESGSLPIGLTNIPGSPTLERIRTSEDLDGGAWKKRDQHPPSSHTRSMDCAICMQVLEVPVVPAGQDAGGEGASVGGGMVGGVAGLLARRAYMVTPCRHVFHSTCLEGWMRFRLQCPICREGLPPL